MEEFYYLIFWIASCLAMTNLVPQPQYILVHTIRCKTTLSSTHDRLSELVTVGRHIASRIESFYGCLLSLIDNDTSFCIFLRREMIDKSSIWNVSNGDEYPIERKCGSILEENRPHSHHISLDLCYFREVVKYDIRVFFGFFDPDILGSNLVSSDKDMDFTSNLSKIESFSDGCIPTTNHCY